ncbi:MerR family transcriptional regulator [Laceyella putida]|uniref:MerR family transcriptional regulator n=1 Tax=Laceyella putida TaxID=110101 RepID=A0ABW2RM52_9BACL
MLIHEMAAQLNVTPRTIRFYEEKGLIQPTKQPDNGYRYFTEADAWRLSTILTLRETGMPLAQIKHVLDEIDAGHPDEVLYYLELQRAVMFEEFVRTRQTLTLLDQMIGRYQPDASTWHELWQLAQTSRRNEEIRQKWQDRWQFDRIATRYDQMVREPKGDFDVHRDYEQGLDLAWKHCQAKPDETGLEIGIGTGNLAGRFLARGIRLHGIDQSKEMLKICRRKYPEIETRLGNFLAIPYPDRRFDFLVTSFAFHHLTPEQKRMALLEMTRVLKPSGRIVILDLMFPDEQARQATLHYWRKQGRPDVIKQIEDEYYADISQLRQWLSDSGYEMNHQPVNDLLHLVVAKKQNRTR